MTAYLAVTGPVVYPLLAPGPDLSAELMMSGICPPGGFHNTTAVLPDESQDDVVWPVCSTLH